MNPDLIAATVADAVRDRTSNSARSAQAAAHILGPSDLGGCRAYMKHMIVGTPSDPSEDPKWAAFVGTAVGDHVEAALGATTDAQTQVPIAATLPSGRQTSGTADIVWPNIVGDVKSKDGLEVVKRAGPTFTNLAQINTYLLGAIQAGLVPPDAYWALIYVDRSGRDPQPHVVYGQLDEQILAQIDARIDDVEYAIINDEDAPRDEPYDFCRQFCQFFTSCRGGDLHAAGRIDDERAEQAVKLYREGATLAKDGGRLKDEAKQMLDGISGIVGGYAVSWTVTGESTYTATRKASRRLNVREVKTKG